MSAIVGYSPAHYKRLLRNKSNLQRAAANRLYRFAQVLERALELYDGDEQAALTWLKNPNPAFNGQLPIDLLASEVGADLVDDLIIQLELGILPA